MKQWTTIDKTEWGPGPWQEEPDKIVWIDEATDLDCMIHRGNSGALCGYVGVGPDHPWHGVQYSDYIDDNYTPVIDVDVHGGLTFSNRCNEDATEDNGICHVPEEGQPHDVWWLGFDCAHAMDVSPRLDADLRKYGTGRMFSASNPLWHTSYKDVTYVRREVEGLARQVKAASGP